MFFHLGYARTERDFEAQFDRMRKHGEKYVKWLLDIPKEQWAQAFDGGRRYGHMTTNLVECINSTLKGVRNQPITSIVMSTYYRLAQLFTDKGKETFVKKVAGHRFPQSLMDRMEVNVAQSNQYDVVACSRQDEVFVVRERSMFEQFTVDLRRRFCDCGNFQTDRYPCVHVVACCGKMSMDWGNYVDPVYMMDNVCKVYEREFPPIGHSGTWRKYNGPTIHHNPELLVHRTGRPKSTRFLNEMDRRDGRQPRRCGLCKERGHLRTACPHRNQ